VAPYIIFCTYLSVAPPYIITKKLYIQYIRSQ